MNRATLVLAGSLVAGLLLGLAIRRARLPVPQTAVEARSQLPSRERIHAALLRAELRDLDARLAALREEGEHVAREKLRLEALTEPPPPPSPEALIRSNLRSMLGNRRVTIEHSVLDWLAADPANVGRMLKIAGEVFREQEWGILAFDSVETFLNYFISNLQGEAQENVLAHLRKAQAAELDPLLRGWMLRILERFKIELSPEQRADLARAFRESKDARLRESAFPHLLKDAASYGDLIRDAVRSGDPKERARHLLAAWSRRALPGGELRTLAREIMKSDDPSTLIMEAQDWVPKFINPLAPQETVALFDQTFSKPIAPVYKAISMMVLGSIATLFPAHPGRAEIERVVNSTDDARLKEFGGKVISLIDEGKGYAEIRQLNPIQFGFEVPKK
jgi:hypothetical protein